MWKKPTAQDILGCYSLETLANIISKAAYLCNELDEYFTHGSYKITVEYKNEEDCVWKMIEDLSNTLYNKLGFTNNLSIAGKEFEEPEEDFLRDIYRDPIIPYKSFLLVDKKGLNPFEYYLIEIYKEYKNTGTVHHIAKRKLSSHNFWAYIKKYNVKKTFCLVKKLNSNKVRGWAKVVIDEEDNNVYFSLPLEDM